MLELNSVYTYDGKFIWIYPYNNFQLYKEKQQHTKYFSVQSQFLKETSIDRI